MRLGRLIGFGFAALCLLLGLIYLLSLASPQAMNKTANGLIAAALLAIGVGLLIVTLKFLPAQKIEHTVVRKIELPGETELREIKCRNCGGALGQDNIDIARDGSVTVTCPYCSSTYQITEAPLW
ncbi:MAG: hypothetical protein P9L99_20090 [Candidatus Lernaella stagnicola]|nr:hypothetical protein [Candidatus Lernaella stagnicola]